MPNDVILWVFIMIALPFLVGVVLAIMYGLIE